MGTCGPFNLYHGGGMKLGAAFYQRNDVVHLARELLGKRLVVYRQGVLLGGIITETEAYAGTTDRGSHAYGGKRTPRNEVMYAAGGCAYVYRCYGIHHLLNVVTGPENNPQAILIRSLRPDTGIKEMLYNRQMEGISPRLTAGPGRLCEAMGLDMSFNGCSLTGDSLWIEENAPLTNQQIVSTPRIGIGYAGEDAGLPYRFYLNGENWVSRPLMPVYP